MFKSRRTQKLIVYTGLAVFSTAISGLTLPMCGDGTISWAEFKFRWILFGISVLASVFNVFRAALDQETSSTTPPTAMGRIIPPAAEAAKIDSRRKS